jgi:succinate dehydrogenase / fumarate reductase iron-sulfur subunit
MTDKNDKRIAQRLRVLRQDGPSRPETKRWEEFTVEVPEGGTVVSALLELQRSNGSSAPVAFEAACLENACGSCTMLIDGKARKACSTKLAEFSDRPIKLEPLSKFPVERDLIVDRSRIFGSLDRVRAFARAEGFTRTGPTLPISPSLPISPTRQETSYALSRCTTCGACLEACPEYSARGSFVGASVLNQVRRFHHDALDSGEQAQLIDGVMVKGGIADCGKAQNCVEVCPVDIPLVDSIQHVARASTKRLFSWILE